MSAYVDGELMPLVWDQGDTPAYYVYGHVDDHTFVEALAKEGKVIPIAAAKIERSYARFIPVHGRDYDNEIRDCGPGRGAFKVTVVHVEAHR